VARKQAFLKVGDPPQGGGGAWVRPDPPLLLLWGGGPTGPIPTVRGYPDPPWVGVGRTPPGFKNKPARKRCAQVYWGWVRAKGVVSLSGRRGQRVKMVKVKIAS